MSIKRHSWKLGHITLMHISDIQFILKFIHKSLKNFVFQLRWILTASIFTFSMVFHSNQKHQNKNLRKVKDDGSIHKASNYSEACLYLLPASNVFASKLMNSLNVRSEICRQSLTKIGLIRQQCCMKNKWQERLNYLNISVSVSPQFLGILWCHVWKITKNVCYSFIA